MQILLQHFAPHSRLKSHRSDLPSDKVQCQSMNTGCRTLHLEIMASRGFWGHSWDSIIQKNTAVPWAP